MKVDLFDLIFIIISIIGAVGTRVYFGELIGGIIILIVSGFFGYYLYTSTKDEKVSQ